MSDTDAVDPRAARPRPLVVRSAGSLEGKPVPERDWLVPSVLVRGGVSMLSGAGGIGKSLLCLQLQVAAALGEPWLGIALPEPFSSFGFYCEDDEDEVHRRLYGICRHYRCSFSDLDDRVRFASRVGDANELMNFFARGSAKRTVLLSQVEEQVRIWGSQLVVIDTVADTFLGNENIRPQVRAYVTAMRRIAMINRGGVIITAHPSRAGLADGTGQSGSTGWEGSVRSRLYFTRPQNLHAESDGAGSKAGAEDERSEERVLKTMKSNYGPPGEVIRTTWQAGVFVRIDQVDRNSLFDKLDHDRRILDAAAYLVARGSMLPADPNARTSLVVVARNLPVCSAISWKAALAAQERLIEQGKLVIVELGPRSKRRRYVRPAHLRYPGEDDGAATASEPAPALDFSGGENHEQ
jgi:RecA-family ATPase